MTPVVLQHLLWAGSIWWFAGYSVSNVLCFFSCLFVGCLSLHHEGLANTWKIQMLIQIGCDPDFSGREAPMIAVSCFMICLACDVFKIKRDVFKQVFLIALSREVIVCLSDEQVIGKINLSQESVGRYGFALDVDGMQQRGRRFDFVGLF